MRTIYGYLSVIEYDTGAQLGFTVIHLQMDRCWFVACFDAIQNRIYIAYTI